MELKYKRPFWCEKGTERDFEMQFMYHWLQILKPANILDVGFAGSGYIDMILELGIGYTGMDSSLNRLTGVNLSIPEKSDTTMSKEHWRKILTKIKIIHDDIVMFPVNPIYNLTMSISVIEHMVYSDYGKQIDDIKAVDRMKQTIKKNGHLMLTFPCGIEIRLPKRDILIYDSLRIKRVIGDWQIVDQKYYICDKVFKESNSMEALSYLHRGRNVESLCCLLLKK